MAVKMDASRISKWQCIFCGSRNKKIATATKRGETREGTEVGFSMICCSCGHVDNFATAFEGIPVYAVGSNGDLTKFNVACGCPETVNSTCEDMACPCRKKEPVPEVPAEPPRPVVPPLSVPTPPKKIANEIGGEPDQSMILHLDRPSPKTSLQRNDVSKLI